MSVVNDSAAAQVTTTNATLTTLLTYALASNVSAAFLCLVSAKNTGTNKSANTVLSFGAQNISGTASILGTAAALLSVANGSDATMSTCLVTISSSGGNVIVQGTGIAATNIQWSVTLWSAQG